MWCPPAPTAPWRRTGLRGARRPQRPARRHIPCSSCSARSATAPPRSSSPAQPRRRRPRSTRSSSRARPSSCTSVAEETEAKTIITTIRDTHGIAVDSLKAATATKDAYQNAPKKARDKIKALPWRMKDLRAVKRAVEHYAPILGKARATSKRSKAAQEATTLGKVNTSITEDTKKGRIDPGTLGEFYDTDRAFAIYKSSETNTAGLRERREADRGDHDARARPRAHVLHDQRLHDGHGRLLARRGHEGQQEGGREAADHLRPQERARGPVRVGDALLLRREAAEEEVPEAPRGDRRGGQGLDDADADADADADERRRRRPRRPRRRRPRPRR